MGFDYGDDSYYDPGNDPFNDNDPIGGGGNDSSSGSNTEGDNSNYSPTHPVDPRDLAQELVNHYEYGNGDDYKLTKKQVKALLKSAIENDAIKNPIEISSDVYKVTVNFYDTDLGYALAFGKASMIVYNDHFNPITPISFYDYWDLDSKSIGERSLLMELITRSANFMLTGDNFKVVYP